MEHHQSPDAEQDPDQPARTELPQFSRRLGAPIATVKPVGKPPSQVTGRPPGQPQPSGGNAADMGVLPESIIP